MDLKKTRELVLNCNRFSIPSPNDEEMRSLKQTQLDKKVGITGVMYHSHTLHKHWGTLGKTDQADPVLHLPLSPSDSARPREKEGKEKKKEGRGKQKVEERAKCGNIIEKEKAKKCEAARRPY